MTASAAGELIDKYDVDIVAKGLTKLGIDGDRIKNLIGIVQMGVLLEVNIIIVPYGR